MLYTRLESHSEQIHERCRKSFSALRPNRIALAKTCILTPKILPHLDTHPYQHLMGEAGYLLSNCPGLSLTLIGFSHGNRHTCSTGFALLFCLSGGRSRNMIYCRSIICIVSVANWGRPRRIVSFPVPTCITLVSVAVTRVRTAPSRVQEES